MTEALLTKKVISFLKELPKCWHFKVWGGGFQRRGIPDIIGVLNGRFFALELKASDGKPTPLQIRCLELISDAGGYARVVYPNDLENIKKEMRCIYYESD